MAIKVTLNGLTAAGRQFDVSAGTQASTTFFGNFDATYVQDGYGVFSGVATPPTPPGHMGGTQFMSMSVTASAVQSWTANSDNIDYTFFDPSPPSGPHTLRGNLDSLSFHQDLTATALDVFIDRFGIEDNMLNTDPMHLILNGLQNHDSSYLREYLSEHNLRVHGSAQDDVITTGGGKDLIRGGKGNDVLDGGPNNDVLVGGGGADQFVFSSTSFGWDTVHEFSSAKGDKLVFSSDVFATPQDALNAFCDGVLSYDAANKVVLTGVTSLQLSDIVIY